jgi:hypothetical protein
VGAVDRARTIEPARSNLPEIATIEGIYDLISFPRSSFIFMGIFSRFGRQSEPSATPPPPPGKTPEELAAVMLELLGRLDELNSPGRVKGWLMGEKVKEAELAGWLRQYGGSFSGEEIVRLRRFERVMNGVLEVAARDVLSRRRQLANEAQVWFDRGTEQYMAGDMAGAIASFDQAVQIKPNYHEAWYCQGVSLYIAILIDQ